MDFAALPAIALPAVLPTIGWAFLAFVVVFALTAALGSDGGTLSKEFPWQVGTHTHRPHPLLVCSPWEVF